MHELRQAVEAQPDGASVWLAKIRIDIFEYLLKRYAIGDVDLDREQPKTLPTGSRPEGLPREPNNPPLDTRRATLWASPPKPKPRVRSHLRSITEANAPRYEDYEQTRIDLLSDRLEAIEQMNALIESILDRHRRDTPGQAVNELELARLVQNEIRHQFRP
ncbi:MAG: hypothetical protein AAF593_15550 [Planctomycetota bacterium]